MDGKRDKVLAYVNAALDALDAARDADGYVDLKAFDRAITEKAEETGIAEKVLTKLAWALDEVESQEMVIAAMYVEE